MRFDYEKPGVLNVIIEDKDETKLRRTGSYIHYNSPLKRRSRTRIDWVNGITEPQAYLDSNCYVRIELPLSAGVELPLYFDRGEIGGEGDDLQGRLDWYFGHVGGINLVAQAALYAAEHS